MRLWTRSILGVTAVALAACGAEDEPMATGKPMAAAPVADPARAGDGPNQPPVIERISLSPRNPRPGERIRARVEAHDPDGDAVHLRYEWRVRGERVGDGPSLHPEGHPKGTVIELRVEPHDGDLEGAIETATVQIGNQPPVMVGIVLEPLGEVSVNHDVVASPRAIDPDGDALEFRYAWTINGEPGPGDEAVLPKEAFERGDRITLTVTADDGRDESEPLESQPFEVVNAAPAITSTPGGFGDDGAFRYQVAVSDPDGDRRLRYRLLEAPEGMTVDLLKGTVVWTPAESQTGSHPVVIEVDDMAGGRATQSFQVQVAFDGSPPANAAD